MCASLSWTRRLHSAAASWLRSLMPSKRPSSSKATAATIRPSSRARRTRSVRYSSPVVLDGREAGDAPPEPLRVERVQAGVGLVRLELVGRRVLGLDDALDRAELAAHHAAQLGRLGREHAGEGDRGIVGPSRVEHRVDVRARHERHVARQDEDLGRVGRDALEGDAHGVAGPGGRRLEGERRPIGERRGDRLDRGRVDDDRRGARRPGGRARPGVEDVGEHRAAAQLVEDLRGRRAHARAEARRQDDGGRAIGRGRVGGGHEGRRRRPRVERTGWLATRAGPGAGGWAVIRKVPAW